MWKIYFQRAFLLGSFTSIGAFSYAQQVKDTIKTNDVEEVKITVGSRNKSRIITDSPVPIDVLKMSELAVAAPQTDLTQILNYVAPSFTSNTTTVADGTDHVDPAQLRGLGPDQTLMLVNGKRRHNSALVNVNGSPGRGSVGTDLNAIPAFAVENIEVLRDGAAAQYGSDAIAGVINLVMKRATNKLNLSLTGGSNISDGSNDHRGGFDGFKTQLDANYGTHLYQGKGFINVTGSFSFRDDTSRATDYNGTIYNAYNSVERVALANGNNITSMFSNINALTGTAQSNLFNIIKTSANQVNYFSASQQSAIQNAGNLTQLQDALRFDTSANELFARGLQRKDFNMRVGQSKLTSTQFFANAEYPINDQHKVYLFGGYSNRDGNSAGFYRRPEQSRSLTSVYPDGFLPEIGSRVIDYSIAGGVKGKVAGFDYDLSNTFGINSFDYTVENTANVTLGTNTPTDFNAGKLKFQQNTTNLDFVKKLDLLGGFNIAFGAEARLERYIIKAGNENSYATYNSDGTVYAGPATPNILRPTDFFGNFRPGGAQVFPGFRPANQVNNGRESYAGYIDTELDITKWLLISGALRYENYSDFGSTFNYKFASRIKLTDNLNLRGAISTGFRAPSLAQINYSSTSTQFIGGVPFEVGTFRNGGTVANILGIPQLKQEESNNYSLGITYKIPETNLTFAVDGYYIKINDRVVLTDGFSPSTPQLTTLFNQANANTATFFSNAVDTQSRGLDVVISNKFAFDEFTLNTSLAGTMSKTERIGDINGSPALVAGGQINKYYSEATRIYMEEAIPRVKANLINSLKYKKFDFFIRQSYFGKVTDPNTADVNGDGYIAATSINGVFVETEHPEFKSRTITDLSVTYSLNKKIKFTVGSNNIFDLYPDKNLKTQLVFRPDANGKYKYVNTSGATVFLQGPGGPVSTLPADYKSGAAVVDLSNNNQFEYSRNVSQFGQNGRYVFVRVNYSF
ncbi:TonB-dependent receptor plug domain-containing protein [Halpernia frigidisoli]|uniref:Iron complex outermembrane recepter protein n=1 Tax=Halpernia frigidisoli TaxID=1125876 RepID=A0A1I3FHL7_9FLAO|nr:TonB-dependent receptor [Halpernia frigidisoli]SFI10713.1 iron complex outermembrane recepter protein [Halpernia frigidisoli]